VEFDSGATGADASAVHTARTPHRAVAARWPIRARIEGACRVVGVAYADWFGGKVPERENAVAVVLRP